VDRELPAGGSAHRKPSDDDAVLVDPVPPLDAVERFEQVDLARELVGIAIPAVRMEHDRIERREISERFQPARDEAQLAERLAAPVKPAIHTMAVRALGVERLGDHEPVRLHGAVDF
jgi:hypothetical protein